MAQVELETSLFYLDSLCLLRSSSYSVPLWWGVRYRVESMPAYVYVLCLL